MTVVVVVVVVVAVDVTEQCGDEDRFCIAAFEPELGLVIVVPLTTIEEPLLLTRVRLGTGGGEEVGEPGLEVESPGDESQEAFEVVVVTAAVESGEGARAGGVVSAGDDEESSSVTGDFMGWRTENLSSSARI